MENNIEFVTDKDQSDCFSLRFPTLFYEHATLLTNLRTIKGIKIGDIHIDLCPPYFYLDSGLKPEEMYEPVKEAIKECFGDKYTVSHCSINYEASWLRFRKKMRKKGYDF